LLEVATGRRWERGQATHAQFEPVQRRLRQALQTGAAEQALRTLVLKRKISGPTRSRRGHEFIARGYSAMESCHRQGRDLLDYLHGTVIAWIDKTTPPSLVPASALRPVPTG
jgi:hypothetical protein